MLRKLIKYDFKSIFRSLLPLCGAFIIIGALTGLSFPREFTDDAPTGMLILWGTILFALIAMTIAVSVISLIIVITRFHKNLLGDEGYLTFTLPVDTKTQLASKCISGYVAFLIAFISGIIAYGLFAVIAVTKTGYVELFDEIRKMLEELMNAVATLPVHYTIVFILTAISGTFIMLLKIYFSIMLGHQFEDHKILMSFAAFIGITIAESLLKNMVSLVIMGVGVAASAFGEMAMGVLLFSLGINVGLIAIYLYGTYYLMSNRLNLA